MSALSLLSCGLQVAEAGLRQPLFDLRLCSAPSTLQELLLLLLSLLLLLLHAVEASSMGAKESQHGCADESHRSGCEHPNE